MGLFDRLMTLFRWLRDPHQKPPVTARLDERLDEAERRLISVESARRARELVRKS